MNNNEVWRLHTLGWTVSEIAERLTLKESNVRKRIVVCWAFDVDGSKPEDGTDSDEDRRNRTRKGHGRRGLQDAAY